MAEDLIIHSIESGDNADTLRFRVSGGDSIGIYGGAIIHGVAKATVPEGMRYARLALNKNLSQTFEVSADGVTWVELPPDGESNG